MNKYQEAFNYLFGAFHINPSKETYNKNVQIIKELVDKQTPVGINAIKGVNHKGEMEVKRYECPKCKYVIYNWLCKRCDKCGQMLDWKGYNS